MIDIINRQRRRKINQKRWRDLAARAIEAIRSGREAVTIVFVSDSAIRKLNKQFRDTDRVTDVLSFPAEPEHFENQSSLGEIVISTDRAGAQAKTNGLSLQNEIEQLILHGLLHLCGYDHETDNGEMTRLELKLRKKLGI
ncbi:MAG TPA: rRNA maturation RNase YbeY [Pyrinomonadaceae bacterium]|nr:rRNA maturation RNase YbeY [Pyrinomonadaceae bacterium]